METPDTAARMVEAASSGDPMRDWDPTGIDVSVPSVARVYDAILGGKDNFEVDRAIADETLRVLPGARIGAQAHRAMMGRGVRFLAEQGIDQFLDLGSGLPSGENTHEIAQSVNPEARVAYIDNDPIVLAHGRALLANNAYTKVATADLRDPADVLSRPEVAGLLDFSRPIALLMLGVIHHVGDAEDPNGVVAAYRDAVAPGSYLYLTHFCASGPEAAEMEKLMLRSLGSGRFRTSAEIEAFFTGFDLVEPGVVPLAAWRPATPITEPLPPYQRVSWGGIGKLQRTTEA